MYVLIVHHDTGHGLSASLVLLTSEADKVAQAMRNAMQNLGYDFYSLDAGIGVYKPELGHVYSKGEASCTCFFRKVQGRWRVEWPTGPEQEWHEHWLDEPYHERASLPQPLLIICGVDE